MVVSVTSRLHSQPSGRRKSIFVFCSPPRDTIPDHGPASQTSGRGAQPKRSGRVATPPLDDERHCSAGFLQQRTHGLSDWTGALSWCEGNPGARSGMETDEEVALVSA